MFSIHLSSSGSEAFWYTLSIAGYYKASKTAVNRPIETKNIIVQDIGKHSRYDFKTIRNSIVIAIKLIR